MNILIEILGGIGAVMVLAAYGLNSYQKIKSDSWSFLSLNIAGGIILIVYTITKAAWANTIINVVWVIIAIPGMIKLLTKAKA
jgi:hypothetical protein